MKKGPVKLENSGRAGCTCEKETKEHVCPLLVAEHNNANPCYCCKVCTAACKKDLSG